MAVWRWLQRMLSLERSSYAHLYPRRMSQARRVTPKDPTERLAQLESYNGFLRQAALESLDQPLVAPEHVILLFRRMNDWVPQVRDAALQCGSRCFPKTRADILATALFRLAIPMQEWQRWKNGRARLKALLDIDGVPEELFKLIKDAKQGPAPRTLRFALQSEAMDRYLPQLAELAVQPGVRAVAVETILLARAQWTTGMKREWINKPEGRSRKVPTYKERAVRTSADTSTILAMSLDDPSAAVRRTGISAAMEWDHSPEELRKIGHRFIDDPSPSIRSRADFILRKLGEEAE